MTVDTNTQEDIYEKMFQYATIGIVLVNTKGIIIKTNLFVETLFGYDPGALLGKPIELLLPANLRDVHQQYREKFQQKPTARTMGNGMSLQAIRKDGNTFPVEISLGHTQLNKELHVIAYINDITERQQMETSLADYQDRLLNYTEDLELKIMQRTKDLEKALMQEKQLGELKSRFVTMASHEFRTPLSSILSSAELLDHYLKNGTLEKGQKNVDRIKNSVHHLTTILNDFLNLGKLEAHTIQVHKKPIVISEWLEEVLEEINPILKKDQSVQITKTTEDKVSFDAYLVKNILLNLLSNASKYSPPNSPIHLEIIQAEDMFTFVVTDKGIGIPKAEHDSLFTRFYRASNAENIQGTGLGLNIVKRYVDLLEGSVEFTSEEGKGSRFMVKLPLK